jgi:hypothetical protein
MKQKLLLGFLLLFSISTATLGQNTTDKPNALHDKLHGILSKSFEVQLPKKVLDALKAHAIQNNLDIKIVMRSALWLKPVYNENLTLDERLFFANHALKSVGKSDFTLPVYLFQEVIDKLNTKK